MGRRAALCGSNRISHAWMMLKARVMEEGAWTEGTEGTPRGAVISPLLANIHLHSVYDLRAEQWRKRRATGGTTVIRYADDTGVGFRRHADAERLLRDPRERLATSGPRRCTPTRTG